jgi:hypothetical protein
MNVSISTPTKAAPTAIPPTQLIPTEVIPATEPPTPAENQYVIPDRPLGIGPWLVFQSGEGLWVINPDASGLTQISGEINIITTDFRDSAAPQGGKLAFISSTNPIRRANLSLEILSLPDGDIRKLTSLTSLETEPGPDSVPGDPEFEAVRAVADLQSFAWSPDGRKLAFMGVIEGPTSDLYVYSIDRDRVSQLTDGPSQAISPTWSPDSNFIVHAGVETLGTGAGYLLAGIWAASADGASVRDLYPIPQGSGNEVVVGWLSPDQFLVYTWSPICGPRTLRIYNLTDGSEQRLWNGFFSAVAFDARRGNVLLTIDDMTAECNEGGVQGIFLFRTGQMAAFEVFEFGVYKMSWAEEVDQFLARFDANLLAVSPEGEASKLTSAPIESDPVISADGSYWAFGGSGQAGGSGVWVGDFGQVVGQVFSGEIRGLTWAPGGEGFFFFSQAGLYFAPTPAFSPILVAEGIQLERDASLVWVMP